MESPIFTGTLFPYQETALDFARLSPRSRSILALDMGLGTLFSFFFLLFTFTPNHNFEKVLYFQARQLSVWPICPRSYLLSSSVPPVLSGAGKTTLRNS
jgi:SNF2 family DNA or RNA helicase